MSYSQSWPKSLGSEKCVLLNLKDKSLHKPEREDVQFTVKIEGEPDVNWYKGDKLLTDEGRYVIVDQDEEQIFTLAIEDVIPEDEGEYRCVAENEAGKSESLAKLFVRDHEYPPEFTNEGQDEPYYAKKGDDLRLDVTLKGKPSPEVKWFLDDKPLRNNIHYDISEDDNEHSLCIRSVTLDDKGVYKCEATSKLGKVTRKFQVNLQGLTPEGAAPTFSQSIQPIEVREGTPEVKFHCQVNGEPRPDIEWYKDDQLLEESERVKFETKNGDSFLCISDISPADEAEYKVLARNPVGTTTSVAQLIVAEPCTKPELIEPLKDMKIQAGEDGCFRVRVKGDVKVDWYKGDELLEDAGHVVIVDEEDGETFTLALEEASAEDTGTYKCVATNKAGTVTCAATLLVEGGTSAVDGKASREKKSEIPPEKLPVSKPPEEMVGKPIELIVEDAPFEEDSPEFLSKFKDCEVVAGSELKLECKFAGSPQPEVEWFKDGGPLVKNNRITCTVSDDSTSLVIKKTEADDEGWYRCRISNERGVAAVEAELIVVEVPTFVTGLEDITIDEGEDVQFTVKIEGEPEVSWYKGGKLLVDEGRYVIVDQDEDQIFTLAIEDILPEDEGEYRCVAENEAGKSESVARVTVLDKEYPPEFTNEGQDEPYFVKKGDDLRLDVTVKGNPLPDVMWFIDDKPLRNNLHYDITEDGHEYSMCIRDVTRDDRGVYKCIASSKLGKVTRKFQVNIEGLAQEGISPEIIQRLMPIEVKEGQTAKFQCRVFGKPTPEIEWYKDDTLIEDDAEGISFDTLDGLEILVVRDISFSDEAEYKVLARNPLGTATSSAELLVEEAVKKPELIEPLKDVQIQPGDDGCFSVRVKGDVKVDWYKGSELLEDAGHVVIVDEEDGETFTLALEETSVEDSGTYKCVATNKAGSVMCTATLKVLGPSGQKTISSDAGPSGISSQEVLSPYFEEPQQDIVYDVGEGDTVGFKLHVHGKPEPEVEWFKDDDKLSEEKNYHITKDGEKHELRLQNMTIEDSGIYKCIASNEEGMDERTFKLDVEDTLSERCSPTILHGLKDCQVVAGKPIELECQFFGTPEPKVEWTKDGGPFEVNDRITKKHTEGVARLCFSKTEADDEGWYKCRLVNPCGVVAVECEMIVIEPPKFVKKLEDLEVDEGEDVQLSVQIEGEPEVNWYKDGTVLEDQGRYVIVDLTEDQVFTFAIEDVLPEDEGEYRCVAENEAGKSESTARLFVSDHEYPPEFTSEGQDEPYVVKEGEDLNFDVTVKGKPFPKVKWFKNDKPLQKNSHFDISENGREFSLGIRNVTLDDRDVYKCEATSKLGKATRKFQLNLKGLSQEGTAPDISLKITSSEVKIGDEARFTCRVFGKPMPEIEWYKDDQLLEESKTVKFENKDDNFSLIIKNASLADEAEYKILARNPLGTASCTADLLVEESVAKPELIEPMTDVQIQPGEDGCFSVRVKGDVKVDWYKGDELLEDAGHVVIVDEEDGETFTLALEEASVEDSGTYKCVATNKAGTITCTATLKVFSREPSAKKGSPEKPSEYIEPQRVEVVNTQPTLDDGKTINLTIDGDSMVVTLPDDQPTVPEKQPKTSKQQPTIADKKSTTPEQKPASPKEKRSPPEKAPKVSPKKPAEDKTPKKPKGTKPDETQRELGKEIKLTIDSESGVMSPSDVRPKEEIEKQKDKKPQVAGKVKPDKEQPKPVEQDVSFTIGKDSLLMTTSDNLPEQEIPQKPKGNKPPVAEKTKPGKEKPFEQIGKEMSFTIDTEAGVMAFPDIPSEREIPQKPKGKKPQVAEKTKPGKDKPSEPVGKEMRFTIDTETGTMASPDIHSEQEVPQKPKGKKPQVATKIKPGKDKPFESIGKEMSFTIDTKAGVMASPNIPSEREIPQKPKGKKPQVAEKTKPGKDKPFESVGKEMSFTIDTEAGLMVYPDVLPETESKKPKGQKPDVAEKSKPKKEKTKEFEPAEKEISFTIDSESLLQASPEALPEEQLKKPKGQTKFTKPKESNNERSKQPDDKEIIFDIDGGSPHLPFDETRADEQSKKPKGKKPEETGKPEQRKPFETVGQPMSLTIDEDSLIMTSPEEKTQLKQTSAPPIMKKSTKDKPEKPKTVEPKKGQTEQPTDKTRPDQKQPKDTAPKVAPKTTKDKTQPPKEKSVKPTRDQQPSDRTKPVEKQPKDMSPSVETKTGEKPLELRIDTGKITVSLPTEETIIPQKESNEQFLAPESESDDIMLPEHVTPRQTKDKPLSAPPPVKDKPKKPSLDSTEDDVGKLPYTTKRDDGLPVWARRPKKPAKDETPSARKPTKPLKTTSDKNKPDRQDVRDKQPEREKVEPVEETKPISVEIGQGVHVSLGPDQGVPIIQLKAKDQPELKPKKAEAKPKEPEVKPKPPEVKQKHQPEVKPKKSEKGKKPGVQPPEVTKPVKDEKEKPVEPGKEVEFVFTIDTPKGETTKPEEKPMDVRKPYESIQDKKDKFRAKPEKNVPEWARKGRAKDTPPPVKPKTKPKSTDTRNVPGEAEIVPEITKDLHEPGVELREGEDAQLKVQFKAPPANVEWFKDGNKLTDKSRCTSRNLGDGCELLVRNVTPRDSGTYVCVVTSEAGSTTRTFQLVIEALKIPSQPQPSDKDVFKQVMTDIEVSEGDDAKFDVRIDGADVEVDWYRDDELLDDAGRIIIEDPHPESDDNLYSLTIENCGPNDSGLYKCVVNINGTERVTSGYLHIIPAGDKPGETKKSEKSTKPNAPVFTTSLQPIDVNPGDTITFECSVTDTSSVEWYKGDRRLTKTSRTRIEQKGDKFTLTIKPARPDDAGAYRCVATGPGGKTESVANVIVRKPLAPPKFEDKLKNTDAKEGDRVQLTIRISGEPTFTWYKDGKLLPMGDRFSVECLSPEKGIYALCIDNVNLTDTGRYKCVAKNPAGECFCSTNLQVKEKLITPAFGEVTLNIDINEGDDMRIEIPLTAKPPAKVTWYKDKVQLYNHARCKMQKEGDVYTLVIKEATPQDAGTYKVVAKNTAGSAMKEINVTVTVPEKKQTPAAQEEKPSAPVFKKKMSDVEVKPGDDAIFEVHVPDQPELDWYKDGILIEDEGRFVIEDAMEGDELYRLTIENCEPSDYGTYTCLIKNDHGESTCSAQLVVSKARSKETVEKPSKVKELFSTISGKAAFEPETFPDQKTKPTFGKDYKPAPKEMIKKPAQVTPLSTAPERAKFEAQSSPDQKTKKFGKDSSLQSTVRGKPSPYEGKDYADANGALRKKSPLDIPPGKRKVLEPMEGLAKKPKFLKEMKGGRVDEGESIVLDVEAINEPFIDWFKDGVLLDDGGRIIIEDAIEGETLYKLTIKDATTADSGEYKCIASNDAGEISCAVYIEVKSKHLLPEFIGSTTESPLNVPEGQDGKIDVEIRGRPDMTVTWYKNTLKLRNDRHVMMESKGNSYYLTVNKMVRSDAGRYKCVASCPAGNVTKEFEVNVTAKDRKSISLQKTVRKPQFIERPKHTDVSEGEDAIFTIRVSGEPEVTWYHDDKPIDEDARFVIETEGELIRLCIKDTQPEDAGRFKCVAKNKAGESSCTVSLRVKETSVPPGIAPVSETRYKVDEGNDVTFTAKVKGRPEPKITWFKDDVRLRGDARLTTTRNGDEYILTISRTTTLDPGIYKCTASSPAGSSSVEFELVVNAQAEEKKVFEEIGDRPIFTEKMKDADVCQGGEAVFSVRASDSPKMEWYRGDKQIENKGRFTIQDAKDGDDLYQLIIDDVKTSDIGTYVCRVTNDVGKSSCSANLYVDRAVTVPQFIGKDETLPELFEGDELRLRATVRSFPKPDVIWFRNDVRLRGDAYVKLQPVNDEYNVIVRNLKRTDSGVYRCEATTSAGTASKEFKVEVKEKQTRQNAATINKGLKETYELEEGNPLKLQCDISGRPAPEVEWFKDDEPAENIRQIKIDNVSGLCTLKIKSLKPEHSGTYRCVATNPAGSAETATVVKVMKEIACPEMKERLRNKDIREGEGVKLELRVTGQPELTWTKDGKAITSQGRFLITDAPTANNTYSLEIRDCTLQDSGRYKCVAKNSRGQVFCSCTLTVLEKQVAPVFSDSMNVDVSLQENEELRLEVNVSGKPEPRIKWFKNNFAVMQTSGLRIEQKSGKCALVVAKAKPSDSGTFKCVASNIVGSGNKVFQVSVKAGKVEGQSPVFLEELQPVKLKEGRSARLECKLQGQPLPKVEWHKDDEKLDAGGRIKTEREGQYCVLAIKDCKPQDSGVYMCVAYNDFGSIATSAELKVDSLLIEPEFEEKLKSIEVTEGKEATFTVKVNSNSSPTVTWFKDNKDIAGSGRYMLTSIVDDGVYSLVIRNCEVKDTGRYSCIANNDAGETKCSGRLEVKPSVSVPVFESGDHDEPVEVEEGGKLQLLVNVKNKPYPKVKWYKDGRLLLTGAKLYIRSTGGEYSLEVPRVTAKDAGLYKCVATSPGGSASKVFNVTIADSRKSRSFGVTSSEESVKHKRVIQKKQVAAVEPQLKAETESGVECFEPSTDKVEGDGQFQPQFARKLQDLEVVEGSAARFDIIVKGNPEPDVSWYKDNQAIFESRRIKFLYEDDGLCSLVVRDITTEDRGKYKCVASNRKGKIQCSCELFVEVHGFEGSLTESDTEPLTPKSLSSEFLYDSEEERTTQQMDETPKISLVLRSKTVSPGSTAKFACRYQSKTRTVIEWTKDGTPLRPDSRHKMEHDGDLCALTILRANAEDVGEYTVVLKNDAGQSSCSASLLVEDSAEPERDGMPPKFVLSPNKTVEASITCSARMECKAVGDPKPDVKWYKEKLEIVSNDKCSVYTGDGGVCTLIVEDVTYEDEGTYKAIASNEFGKVTFSTKLIVKAGDISSDESDARSGSDQGSIKERPISHSLRTKRTTTPTSLTSDSKRLPEFTVPLRDKQSPAGATARLSCRVVSKSRLTAKWYKDGQPIRSGGRFDVQSDFASQTLVIRDCRVEDSGEYKCEAKNIDGVSSTVAMLAVQGRSTQSRQPVSVKPPTKGQFTWSKTSKDRSHETPETTPGTSKSYGKQKTELKTQQVERESEIRQVKEDTTESALPDVAQGLQTASEEQQVAGSRNYVAVSESVDKETGKKFLIPGDIVEVLDRNPSGLWLVRRISRSVEIGFVLETILEEPKSSKMEDEELSEESGTTEEYKPLAYHIMLSDYKAQNENEITVSINDEIEVLDNGDLDFWFIDNLSTEREGFVPSYLVQEVSQEEFKRVPKDQRVRVREAKNQMANVVNALIDGERKYVKLLRFLIENHLVEMDSDDLPDSLVGKKDELFSNIKDIYTFHTRTFLHELEACVKDPNDVAKVFLRHKSKLKLYAKYLQDRLHMELLLSQPEINDFFKEFQEDIEDPLFVTDYLNKPIQRLQEYQYSLQDLLKYTARANLKCRDVEEALQVASKLSQQAQGVLRIASLDMYSGEIPLQQAGKLLRQGTVLFWEDKPRGKGKEREIFLFEKVLINARRREDGKRYIVKFAMKISSLGLTEDITVEPKKWSLWVGNSARNPSVLHTFEGRTVEVKESWVNAIKDLIDAQGNQATSKSKEDKRNLAPAIKEKVPGGSTHEELFTEVEKQYVVVTAPKVSPKPKKPVKDGSSSKVEGAPPVITKGPGFKRSKPGETVTFDCSFAGDPEPAVTWSKDGVTIKNGGRFTITIKEGFTELSIEKLQYSDAGNYQIALANPNGNAWAEAILDMNAPPNITNAPKGVVAKAGSSALFPCSFTAHPQPSVKWSKNSVEIKNEGRFHILIEENFTQLEITDLVKSDDGDYRLDLQNAAGSYWASAGLVVTGGVAKETRSHGETTADNQVLASPPGFTKTPKGTVAKAGTSVTFPTTFTGDPEPNVVWTKDDVKIASEGRFYINTTGGASTLKISNVGKADNGWYKIALNNPSGWAWASAQLVITGAGERHKNFEGGMEMQESGINAAPNVEASRDVNEERKPGTMAQSAPVFSLELVDCKTKDGNAARFVGRVSSQPPPMVKWFKDDKLLHESRQYSFLYNGSSCTLIITRSKEVDVGSYKCVATNSLGSASSSARLILEEVGGESGESSSESEDETQTDVETKSVTLSRSSAEDVYTMKDELGRGKFGIVKKCVDKATGREYAAKFIACNGKAARDEVLHEIEVMNELNHKRLLRLEAAFDLGKEMVLVMELITGGELFEKLVEEDYISEKIATSYLGQLLDGLGYMHRKNILHLDLKPENMMLVRPGSKRIKIIDYGLARKYNPSKKLQVMQGTPEFAAPEVIAYEGVTPATDVWAVGVITYVVLSGLSPFLGDDDGETMSNISSMAWEFDDPVFDEVTKEAKDFISKILIKDDRKRMSILECQAHSWLKTKSNNKIETQRLKAFTARRKWKKALTAVRSTNFLSRILNKSGKGGDKSGSAGKGAFLAKIKQQIAAEESVENSESTKDENQNITPKIKNEVPQLNGDIKQDGNKGQSLFIEELQDQQIQKGSPVTLTAKIASTGAEPKISWKKDAKALGRGRARMTYEKGTLTLKYVRTDYEDAGLYTVEVDTGSGVIQSSAKLEIADVPDSPSPPEVSDITTNSLKLSWRAPRDGHSPIINYVIEYRKTGEKDWTLVPGDVTSTTHLVEDLTPRTSYRFRISAVNKIGSSRPSRFSGMVETKR